MGTSSSDMAGMSDLSGSIWQSQYYNEVQAIQSRVQHHWHLKNEKGDEVPMPYCKLKKKSKKIECQCKMGFPRKVLPKVRPRVVCPGIAFSLGLQCSGRRNALGSIAGPRRCAYFSVTSRILSKIHKSNTNVQLPRQHTQCTIPFSFATSWNVPRRLRYQAHSVINTTRV